MVFMPGYGKFRKVLLDGIYEEFYLITQLKREYVAEICASLGFSAAGNNDKIGLILYADKVLKVVPPQKGRTHVLSIISNILSADYVPAKSNLDVAFNYMMSVFKRKSLVFLFSVSSSSMST